MRRLVTFLFLALCVSCSRDTTPTPSAPVNRDTPAQRATTAAKVESKPRVVFLGDSLTAGLGLPSESSFPSLIQKKLKDRGLDYEVVNAGVSGDTSAGGLRRLDWSLEGDVRVLIVALGGNDGLRGLPI